MGGVHGLLAHRLMRRLRRCSRASRDALCPFPPGETANGKFPTLAVDTMAHIVANAEHGTAYVALQTFIRYRG